jgi:predicted small lipoprotein YifL
VAHALIAALAAGCGQKGDLYLPPSAGPAARATPPASGAPPRPEAAPGRVAPVEESP